MRRALRKLFYNIARAVYPFDWDGNRKPTFEEREVHEESVVRHETCENCGFTDGHAKGCE